MVIFRRRDQKTLHDEVRREDHKEIQRRVPHDPVQDRRDLGLTEACGRCATRPNDDQERQEIEEKRKRQDDDLLDPGLLNVTEPERVIIYRRPYHRSEFISLHPHITPEKELGQGDRRGESG